MANNRVYTESVVTLNNQEAMARIDEIKRKAAELRQEMARIAAEKGINSKEFKEAQKELVALVKSEKDAYDGMKRFEKIMNNLNGANLNELQTVAKKLNQQLRGLKPGTEEFIATSRKLKEVRTRMQEISKEAKATQSVFGGFFKKIGWAGLIAGGINLLKKFGESFLSQTKLIGDKFNYEVAGWKTAYQSFIVSLSSGKGFSEMISDMGKAYIDGKRIAAVLDEIIDRKRNLQMSEARDEVEIEKLRRIVKDSTEEDETRIAAAEKLMKMERDLADERKQIAIDEEKAKMDKILLLTGLTKEELLAYTEDKEQNKAWIESANQYLEEIGRLQHAVDYARIAWNSGDNDAWADSVLEEQKKEAEANLQSFIDSTDGMTKHYADIIKKFNLANNELLDDWAAARTAMYQADSQFLKDTQRINQTSTNLQAQMHSERQSRRQKAAEEARRKQEEAYKQEVDAEKAHTTELKNLARQAYLDGELTREQYDARILELDEESLTRQIAIGERFKKSVVELQAQLLELGIKEKERLQRLADEEAAELQRAIDEVNAEIQREIDEALAEADAELQAYIDHWQELVKQADEIKRELDPVAALQADRAAEFAQLDELYENNLISEEEYQQKRAEIVKRYNKQILASQMEPYKKGVETAKKYLDQVSNFMEALQSASTARLDAQMEAELTAAGDNAEKREEIEAKYEAKKLETQKKYATVSMVIEIAKTIAAGALSVMQGFAELGPIGGAVFAALIAATTIAQVATIVAQRNAIMNASPNSSGTPGTPVGERVATGYSGGGFTKSSSDDYEPVGVVHANEWVAPAAMVRANPVQFAELEAIRRSGNYRSGIPGFADGGETSPGTQSVIASPDTIDNALLVKLNELLEQLLASLPIRAYVLLTDINAALDLDAAIKKLVGKKSE